MFLSFLFDCLDSYFICKKTEMSKTDLTKMQQREDFFKKKIKNKKKYIEQPQNNSHIIYSCQQQVADNHKVGTKVQRQVGPEDRKNSIL